MKLAQNIKDVPCDRFKFFHYFCRSTPPYDKAGGLEVIFWGQHHQFKFSLGSKLVISDKLNSQADRLL